MNIQALSKTRKSQGSNISDLRTHDELDLREDSLWEIEQTKATIDSSPMEVLRII
jgi:hypothetical protein